jgi:carbon storage regulator
MLVLSRQKSDEIMIGENVVLTICDVRGNTVRVGITAPRSISVHRKEIYLKIQKEKEEGSKSSTDSSTDSPEKPAA